MNQVIRIVADWLASPSQGVNVLLPLVPRGTDPEPPAVTVEDESRYPRAARGRVLDDDAIPRLVVGMRWATLGQEVVSDDGYFRAEVLIWYARRHPDPVVVRRDGNHTLRAASWALRRFRALDANHTAREQDQVRLLLADPIQWEPWTPGEDDTVQLGLLVLPITGRDLATLP